MTVMVWGRVLYACSLSDEDEGKVRKKMETMEPWETPKDIVEELYFNDEIDLYKYATESDFMTEKIEDVEED